MLSITPVSLCIQRLDKNGISFILPLLGIINLLVNRARRLILLLVRWRGLWLKVFRIHSASVIIAAAKGNKIMYKILIFAGQILLKYMSKGYVRYVIFGNVMQKRKARLLACQSDLILLKRSYTYRSTCYLIFDMPPSTT